VFKCRDQVICRKQGTRIRREKGATGKGTLFKGDTTVATEKRLSTLITITIMVQESHMHMIGIGRKIQRGFVYRAAP
jgi:hypothetical protein